MAKVLIIDDDVEFVQDFTRRLQNVGLEPSSALSAADAFEYLKKNEVDFIVLDFILPEMDGLSFYKKLKSDLKKEIPTIVLTNASGVKGLEDLQTYEKREIDLDTLAKIIKNKLSPHENAAESS